MPTAADDRENRQVVADWYLRAKLFPQKHPEPGQAAADYANRYGAAPDSPETMPWGYQQEPEKVTPYSWKPVITTMKFEYFDPRTGEVYRFGQDPSNDLDPTAPAFTEPPEWISQALVAASQAR